jgi:[protein-PII] uridylyltransferase
VPELVADPGQELRRRSDQVDDVVGEAFKRLRPEVTVCAVGGYGRRELFPYSDVDLLLLTDTDDPPKHERQVISEFLKALWDAGLRVSQSVRTPADCGRIHVGNLELTISLLDHRYLCGDRTRYDALAAGFSKLVHHDGQTIADELSKNARARHSKYNDTIYHLEPNVKEHPGALRDLHVLHWLGKLKQPAAENLEAARKTLYTVRIFLHQLSGRDNNSLSFDAQELLSRDAGAWMREYYRSARSIYSAVLRAMEGAERTDLGLIAQFRDWRGRLSNADFTVARERVLLRDPHALTSDPEIVLRLMIFIARHRLRLGRDTEERIRASLPGIRLAGPNTWTRLRELFRLPNCAAGLRAMQTTGVLAELIPEWNRIDCLVRRDFYHRYTVDEHTLLTIAGLETLTGPTEGLAKRFSELLTEIDRPELLRLALLLHDIGKGAGAESHTTESLKLAAPAMERLGVPEPSRATVGFLIEHHLDLSSVMNSRDLSDAATAKQVAGVAGTVERLKLLTLMTWADISAVNPTAMTPWRLEQLWRTYLAGYHELTRELATARIDVPDGPPAMAAFLKGLPIRYQRTHSEDEIRAHFGLWKVSRSGAIGIDVRKAEGAWQMTVVMPDKPFLLASISGAIASFGLNILKAEAFSNAERDVVDTFAFADPHRTLELNPSEVDRLRDTVVRVVTGRVDVTRLLAGRRRAHAPAGARISAAVTFNDEASPMATLIEVTAEDRPGLLYDLTSTLSTAGLNIEVVLIDTEAHKALDVFYVTHGGQKLAEQEQQKLRETLLAACA